MGCGCVAPTSNVSRDGSTSPRASARASQCYPVPPARKAEFENAGRYNFAALAGLIGQPVVKDQEEQGVVLRRGLGESKRALTSLNAPDFRCPTRRQMHSLSEHRGKKILLGLMGLMVRMPHGPARVAGALHRTRAQGLRPIAVAFDSAGNAAAEPWIKAANPTYPCLIDQPPHRRRTLRHGECSQRCWIDENGKIVRPSEPAGSSDAFRKMDHVNFSIPPDALAELQAKRLKYLDASAGLG